LSKAKDNITEPGEKEILDRISTQYSDYIKKFYILNDMQSNAKLSNAQEYYYNDIFPIFESVKNECRNLLQLNQNAMLERKNAAHQTADRATYLTVIISIVTIIAGLLISISLTVNKIIKPIENLIQKIIRISEGDYSQKLDVTGNNEISQLAVEFNNMTDKLQAYEQLNIKKIMNEKQKSESIVESISDGIIVSEIDNKIALVNAAAEKTFSIREEDAIGKHLLEVIKNEEFFKNIENVRQDNYDAEIKKSTDITIETDNSCKFYKVKSNLIKDKNNIPIGVVTLVQDITKLKEIDRMKSEFVSTVSHEFRTPLTSMNMSIGLLLEDPNNKINSDNYELLKIIDEDINRLTNLVNDLLDLSRIESGKVQMNIKPCSIDDIIINTLIMGKKQYYLQVIFKIIKILF
jgi:PAS domain S-box-containing protein